MQLTRISKLGATAAIAVGIAAGSYGVASAASGSSSSNAASSTPAATNAAPPGARDAGHPWGGQRGDETPLTSDALAKVKAIAADKLPGASIVRAETDADGNAMYEVHVVKADGTPATGYVDKSFAFVSIETR